MGLSLRQIRYRMARLGIKSGEGPGIGGVESAPDTSVAHSGVAVNGIDTLSVVLESDRDTRYSGLGSRALISLLRLTAVVASSKSARYEPEK